MRLNGEQKLCIINIRLVDFFLELSHGSDEILTMSQTKSFLIKNQVSVSFFFIKFSSKTKLFDNTLHSIYGNPLKLP